MHWVETTLFRCGFRHFKNTRLKKLQTIDAFDMQSYLTDRFIINAIIAFITEIRAVGYIFLGETVKTYF